ncbi:MAG: GNAT family N-acetyltransferase [Anaerolineae bacterium]
MMTPTATPTEPVIPDSPLAFALSDVRLADLRGVARLERLSFAAEAWGWLDFAGALLVGHIFRKAVASDRLLGFIIGTVERDQGITWIVNIAVDPAVRNKGIGRALMQDVEARAPTRRLRLVVRVDNDPARHLYRSLGYQEIRVRPRYYVGPTDGMEMEKTHE